MREQPDDGPMARLQAVREEITAVMAPVLVTRRPTGEAETLRRLRGEEEDKPRPSRASS